MCIMYVKIALALQDNGGPQCGRQSGPQSGHLCLSSQRYNHRQRGN